MLNIGVLVSGGGTNLQAIIDRVEDGRIPGVRIVTVVSSKDSVFALERAAKHQIPSVVISRKSFEDLRSYDEALKQHMQCAGVDLVVMAGFLSIVGDAFVSAFENRVINVHPALIPSFCGKGYYGIVPHQKALEYGVKVTGATVHFVTLEADAGPIILQKAVSVLPEDTAESLQLRVMEEAEWEILPRAIALYAAGKIKTDGRIVRILE